MPRFNALGETNWTCHRTVFGDNPNAIVSFSVKLGSHRMMEAEDFTAAETDNPFAVIPSSRWKDGSQWHVLTYLGQRWARRDTRFPTEQWTEWAAKVVANGGVITLDMGPSYDPAAEPIGTLSEEQLNQVKTIKTVLEKH